MVFGWSRKFDENALKQTRSDSHNGADMKKTAIVLSLILIGLIISILFLTLPVKAEEAMSLTIKSDGSVEPATNLLERNGTTYTFKGDIVGSITVKRGFITIDGADTPFKVPHVRRKV